MPTADRVASQDRDIKHQHSFSDSGKIHIPMWDSSDPDRAPPPLPLNPGTPNASPTKANTSANVAAAAQALVERARESLGASAYVTNAASSRSPEKSPIKTPQHRRLQSLQNVNTKDLRSSYENTPDRPLSRSNSVMSSYDVFSSSPDRTPSRAGSSTPTPNGKEARKDNSSGKASRPPPRPILGENTPPSSTVLALQTIRARDEDIEDLPPLRDITNSSAPQTPQKPIESLLESQLKHLTTIANALQEQMQNLNRRSKDNAADLMSLKDATKTRDEEIRKSLTELIKGAKASESGLLGASPRLDLPRANSALGISQHLLDNKPFSSPPSSKSVSLPRLPPAAGLESEYDRSSSPSPFCIDSTASVAMLEKIIREMGTKEGQERLLSTLSDLMKKADQESSLTAKKVEELVESIRDRPNETKTLVKHNDVGGTFDNDTNSSQRTMARADANSGAICSNPPAASDIVTEELKKMVLKIKDGVTQSGGMTNEVKSLVRDLRAEVLGMGREIAGKLSKLGPSGDDRRDRGADREDLALVIQDGLADLKEHMDSVIQSRRRQSASSSITRNSVDSSEVYAVVKHALAEHGLDQSHASNSQGQGIDQEAIISAVREAYEEYKPEIELQQFGLERDEILQCLKEGLEDYQTSRGSMDTAGLNKEDVLEAVQEGLQHLTLPQPLNEFAELKEEILMSVRECLEEFKPAPKPSSWKPGDISRDEILDAVKQGLGEHRKEGAREIEINKQDLFEAVRAGLDDPNAPLGTSLLNSLHDIVDGMRVEFKQYSAANGRDTEQVLDALKDGLESLRTEVEAYVDRAQDVTGKDEIIEALKDGLHSVHSKIEDVAVKASTSENLRDTSAERTKEELLMALTMGFQQLRSTSGARDVGDIPEETLDALKVEFEQLRDSILGSSANQKDELLDAFRDGLAGIQAGMNSNDRGFETGHDVLNTIREEFAAIRESFSAPTLYSGQSGDKEAVLEAVKESLDTVRIQLASDQNDAANEAMGAIREELEQLRESFSNALVPSASAHNKDEMIEAIRQCFGNIDTDTMRGKGENVSEDLASIRSELEYLRQSLSTSLVQGGSSSQTDDMLETIRLTLESLKYQVENTAMGERSASSNTEIVDTLNESLDNLRIDLAKIVDKPVDMTMSTEILDALKNGLAGVRSDLDILRKGAFKQDAEVVLADGTTGLLSRGTPNQGDALNKDDLQKLEVMLAQLQIKVEALDQNMQGSSNMFNHSENSASKQDLASVESTLRELQTAIMELSSKEQTDTGGVTKEDTVAIETLLYNTKAKIEESVLPGIESVVTKEQFEEAEAIIRATQTSIDSLAAKFGGDAATKDDVAALAHLLDEASTALKDMRVTFENDEDKVTKTDIEVVGDICTDIKAQIDDLPSLADLPSRTDVEQLTELLQDFRESHNTLKDRYDADIEITAKAFDDRKEEAKTVMDQINDLKDVVEEAKNELKSRMRRGNEDVRALDEILQGIEDKIDQSPNAVADVRELTDIVNHEFERTHEAILKFSSAHEENSLSTSQSYETYSKAIIEDLTKRLDDRFGEIMGKHDEQLAKHNEVKNASLEATRSMEARAAQQDDLLAGSRAMAEELRVTIDALGASVTAISPALAEATEKMGDDARTVFNKVEEMTTKLDDSNVDSRTDHQLTRDDIAKCLAASGSLHELLTGFQPQALDALGKLMSMVEQHYEHSRKADESAREKHDRTYDQMTSSFASIPKLEAPPVMGSGHMTKSDDTEVQRKLDSLLERVQLGSTTAPQLEKIDEVHQQVKESVAEISAFIEFQTKMISAEHENKEKEANQTAIDLNKMLLEKETLDANIAELHELKHSLSTDVDSMKAEQQNLMATKTRLTGEVSSLETALKIRREELQLMDSRADALEQRILERVMDHSRSLLIGKAPKKSVNLNLKRVTSNTSNSTAATTVPSAVNAATNMALKPKAARKNAAGADPSARRIHSLSQITNNVPTGAKGFATAPKNPAGGLNNLKRSQSVKNPLVRKTSLAKREVQPEHDKENDDLGEVGSDRDADESANTQRSTSYAESQMTKSDQQIANRRPRHSLDSSVYAFDSISNFTGSELGRRTSIGSTIRTNVGIMSSLEGSIHEDDEDEYEAERDNGQPVRDDEQLSEEDEDEVGADEPQTDQAPDEQLAMELAKEVHPPKQLPFVRTDGYDSGLGSDLPTADLSAGGHQVDYFRSLNNL